MEKTSHEIPRSIDILQLIQNSDKPLLGLPVIKTHDGASWAVCCNVYITDTLVTDRTVLESVLTDVARRDVRVDVFTRRFTKTGKEVVSQAITFIEGTNEGKRNETTSLQAAIVKMQSLHRAMSKKKQVEEQSDEVPKINPMLLGLYKYQDKQTEKQMEFPCYIQRKYDGLRCVAVVTPERVVLQSRGQCEYTNLQHINRYIHLITKDIQTDQSGTSVFFLDGELYSHGLSLQKINSLIKNEKSDTSCIQLRVFDCGFYGEQATQLPFSDRLRIIQNLPVHASPAPVEPVPTELVQSEQQVDIFMNEFLSEGYEGAVLRTVTSPYVFSISAKRSNTTLKYKKRDDLEVKIVSYTCGQARDEDAIMFICEYSGQQFTVVQNTSVEARKKQYLAIHNNKPLIDTLRLVPLTIEYSGLSASGVPQQPRATVFRFDLTTGADPLLLKQLEDLF